MNASDEASTIEDTVLLTHAAGLHARPAIKFMQVATGFAADIEFSGNGGDTWINAKSIAKVMGAKIPSGTQLLIRASGDDAPAAVEAMVALVNSGFEQ